MGISEGCVRCPNTASEHAQRFGRNAVDGAFHASCNLVGEKFHQVRNVLRPFAQRRNEYREDIEPVIEVAAELAVGDHLLQVAVGGGDQTHVDGKQLVAANPLKLVLLEHAQQFRLRLDWDFPTSTKNGVPFSASSKRPIRWVLAPVNAPFSPLKDRN